MGLNPPTSNKPGLVAWRRGFWDQRNGGKRHHYRGKARWAQNYYQAGWYEAESNPGSYAELCYTNEELTVLALQFSIHHGPKADTAQAGLIEAIVPGWRRVLALIRQKRKERRS